MSPPTPAPAVWHASRSKVGVTAVLAVPLLAALLVIAGRVGERARFVTWPVAAFTVLAAVVALVGVWVGSKRPWMLAAGVLPGLVVSYVLPAAPMVAVAAVLLGLAALAVGVRGAAAGLAMTVGAVMVLFVVIQDPAVECRRTSVSSSSGPWWVGSAASSTGSGSSSGAPDGGFSGTTQVGDHEYAYSCRGEDLVRFERSD